MHDDMIRQSVMAHLHGLIMHVNKRLKPGPTGHMQLETRIACASMFLGWGSMQLVQYPWAVCDP